MVTVNSNINALRVLSFTSEWLGKVAILLGAPSFCSSFYLYIFWLRYEVFPFNSKCLFILKISFDMRERPQLYMSELIRSFFINTDGSSGLRATLHTSRCGVSK